MHFGANIRVEWADQRSQNGINCIAKAKKHAVCVAYSSASYLFPRETRDVPGNKCMCGELVMT